MDPTSDTFQDGEAPQRRPQVSNRIIIICLVLQCIIGLASLRHIPVDFFSESDWRLSADTSIPVGDFIIFHTAGTLAAERDFETLYDHTKLPKYLSANYGVKSLNLHFSYPPVALMLLEPFAELDLVTAWRIWTFIGISLLGVALYLLTKRWWVVVFMLANPLVFWAVLTGQMVLILAPLMLIGYLLHQRQKPLASGLVYGLIIVKPHLALALPIIFLWTKDWRTIIGASITVAGLLGLTWITYGGAPWQSFIAHAVANAEINLEVAPGVFYNMMTPTIYATLFGAPKAIVISAQLLGVAAAIWLVYRLWITTPERYNEGRLSVMFLAPALMSPYLVAYDLMGLGIVMIYSQMLVINQLRMGEPVDLRLFYTTLLLLLLSLSVIIKVIPLHYLFPPIVIGLIALLLSRAKSLESRPHGILIGNS